MLYFNVWKKNLYFQSVHQKKFEMFWKPKKSFFNLWEIINDQFVESC